MTKKSIILDATILNAFMGCARLYDLRFNLSFVPISGKGNSLEAGSLVHYIKQYYYQSLIDGAARTEAIARGLKAGQMYYQYGDAFFKQGFTLEQADPPKNIPLDNEKGSDGKLKYIGFNWIMETMQQYFEFYKNDSWIPLESEKVIAKVIYEDEEIRILWKAKIDARVDTNDGIKPVDHKTAKQNKELEDLNIQFMGQCVVAETRMMIVNKIGFQTSLKPIDKFKREVASYSADRLVEWVEIVAYYGKQMVVCDEQNYYPPNFTHCDKYAGCIFRRDVCKADRDKREEELRRYFVVGASWDPNNDD